MSFAPEAFCSRDGHCEISFGSSIPVDASDAIGTSDFDASMDVSTDVGGADASREASVCSFSTDGGGTTRPDSAVAGPIRAIYPREDQSTGARPWFRFAPASDTDATRIDVCADSTCSALEESFVLRGSNGRGHHDLANGMHWWRLTPLWNGVAVDLSGPPMPFNVATRSRAAADGHVSMDLDEDGAEDLTVSATSTALPFRQYVRLYRSTCDAIELAAEFEAPLSDPRRAGDVNGDGFGDLAFGASTFFLSRPEPLASRRAPDVALPAMSGALVPLGDVNADGYDDVATTSTGMVEVRFGSPTGPRAMADQTIAEDGLVAGGDVNGDGYSDVLAGLSIRFGSASGVPSSPAQTLAPPNGDPTARWNSACAGDVDGDGFTDVVVNRLPRNSLDMPRTLWLFRGTPSGLSPGPYLTLDSPDAMQSFSSPAFAIGDANRDGLDDLGALIQIAGGGRSIVMLEVFTSDGASFTAQSTPVNGSAALCGSIADVNRDGFDDVGCWYNTPASGWVSVWSAPGWSFQPAYEPDPYGSLRFDGIARVGRRERDGANEHAAVTRRPSNSQSS